MMQGPSLLYTTDIQNALEAVRSQLSHDMAINHRNEKYAIKLFSNILKF